jgi:hypothetical protein
VLEVRARSGDPAALIDWLGDERIPIEHAASFALALTPSDRARLRELSAGPRREALIETLAMFA